MATGGAWYKAAACSAARAILWLLAFWTFLWSCFLLMQYVSRPSSDSPDQRLVRRLDSVPRQFSLTRWDPYAWHRRYLDIQNGTGHATGAR